jgi:ribosomal protein S18 acetylase RimI-like enzyme
MDATVGTDRHPDKRSPSGESRGPRRLKTFDWADFIQDGALFVNLVGGSIAVGLGALGALPDWMIHSDLLLFLSLAFAFARVWKTVREERESADLWSAIGEDVSSSGGGMEQMKDAVFEIPYLFSIVFMPLSAVSLQTFTLCVLLFYVADNYYNLAILRGLAWKDDRPAPRTSNGLGRRARRTAGRTLRLFTRGWFESVISIVGNTFETFLPVGWEHQNRIDREVLTRFFGRRVLFNRIGILLLAGLLVVALVEPHDLAANVGCVAVAFLLLAEFLVEPSRLLDAQCEPEEADETDGEPLLWTAPAGVKLDAPSRRTLKRIHNHAFPVPERQLTMQFMFAQTGRNGNRLLILTERSPDIGRHEVVGYLFMRARPEMEVAYFWYLAVDEEKRGDGRGRTLVKLAIDLVSDRWPSIQAVFLEASDEVSEFYRHLGFWQVAGVDYKIPRNRDPKNSLSYNPMVYQLRGPRARADKKLVKKAVLAMAADSFEHSRDRWLKDLSKSFAAMSLVAPPADAGLEAPDTTPSPVN